MTTDQVDRLVHEESPTAQEVLGSLPLQTHEAQALKDLIVQDREEPKGALESVMSSMSGVVYAVAIAALALTVWAVFHS